MGTNPAIIREFERRGFAVLPNIVGAPQVAEMRALLQQAIVKQDAEWGNSPYYRDENMVHNLMLHGEAFVDLLSNCEMHAYLAATMDEHCILYAFTSSSIPPKGKNFSSRVHVDSPRFIPNYLTNLGVIVALDDFTDENGATYFLPGSHLAESVPSDQHFFENAERVYPKAGDGVIFNARTFHCGGHNHTDCPRHAVTLNVCRSYMRQRFDYPRLVPESIKMRMNDLGLRFIGNNVRVPVGLDQYYIAPNERLYKANQG